MGDNHSKQETAQMNAEEAFSQWRTSPEKHLKNSLTHPLHVLAGAGMLAAGILFSFWWLMLGAFVIYGLMVYLKMAQDLKKSGYEQTAQWQQSVMELPIEMRMRLLGMIKLAGEIKKDAHQMPYSLQSIEESTEQLVETIIQTACRAVDVERYLSSVSLEDLFERYEEAQKEAKRRPIAQRTADALKEQIDVAEDLAKRRNRLSEELEQLEASLGAVKARMVQASLSSNRPVGIQQELETLRERTRALAEGFGEMERVEEDLEDGLSGVNMPG